MPKNSLVFTYIVIAIMMAVSNLLAANRLQSHDETVTRRAFHCNTNITWLGDNWILPRGCRVYSAPELRAIYGRFSILWIGDSTVRRTYATLRAILQHDNSTSLTSDQVDSPHVIDVNKDAVQERCSKWKDVTWIDPTSLCWRKRRNFDFIQVKCLKDLIPVLRNLASMIDLQNKYDVVVVSVGSWDFAPLKRRECSGGKAYPQFVWDNLDAVLSALEGLSVRIVWRTLPMNQHELEKDLWLQYNEICKKRLPHHVDPATALEPRSVLHERIAGNNIYHWGLKARLLSIQMLAYYLLYELQGPTL